MAIKNFLSGGRELSQISMAKDVKGLSTWVASLFKKTIDAVNETSQAAVSNNEVTGSAAQVLATPTASSGAATPTTLTTAYLSNAPATADAIGAVKPDGTTVTVSAGGVLSATAAAPPSGPANQVYATPDGSAGDAEIRALVSADLPAATNSAQGAVILAGDLAGTATSPEVISTHLASPLPVDQGGNGTGTPSLVAGANVTISGSWPNQTIAASAGSGISTVPLFPGIAGLAPTISGTGLTTALHQSGTFSAANVTGGIRISDPTATSGENIEGIVAAYPSAPFTAQAVFTVPQFSGSNYNLVGLCVASTLTGKLMVFGMRSSSLWGLTCLEYTSPTSYSGDIVLEGPTIYSPVVGFQYADNGTNITFSASVNGEDWYQVCTFAKSSSFLGSSGFNYFGAVIDTADGPVGSTLLAWSV